MYGNKDGEKYIENLTKDKSEIGRHNRNIVRDTLDYLEYEGFFIYNQTHYWKIRKMMLSDIGNKKKELNMNEDEELRDHFIEVTK